MMHAIRHGLGNVFRFSERDGRQTFWLYAAFIYLMTQAFGIIAMAPAMGRIFTVSYQQAARAAEAGAAGAGPEVMTPMIGENLRLMFSSFSGIMYISFAISLLAVLLLAAAVTRRLHDRDRSGTWGLMPVPFLLIVLVLTLRLMSALGTGTDAPFDETDASLLMMIVLANFLYLALLIWLIVLLAGRGTPGPNRYGPPPAPTPATSASA